MKSVFSSIRTRLTEGFATELDLVGTGAEDVRDSGMGDHRAALQEALDDWDQMGEWHKVRLELQLAIGVVVYYHNGFDMTIEAKRKVGQEIVWMDDTMTLGVLETWSTACKAAPHLMKALSDVWLRLAQGSNAHNNCLSRLVDMLKGGADADDDFRSGLVEGLKDASAADMDQIHRLLLTLTSGSQADENPLTRLNRLFKGGEIADTDDLLNLDIDDLARKDLGLDSKTEDLCQMDSLAKRDQDLKVD